MLIDRTAPRSVLRAPRCALRARSVLRAPRSAWEGAVDFHAEHGARSTEPRAKRAPRAKRRPGFTLVEVLVVMIILAILAAVVVPRVVGRTEDARRARAVADIEGLGTALDLYKADNGDYPPTEVGLRALRERPGDARNWNGPYLRKPLGPDPWGNEYIYISPGEQNPHSYDLASLGADGQPGGEGKDADITNWDEG